jgi:AraC-like DNA-binding protein
LLENVCEWHRTRGIERVTGINHNTIINWVRLAGLALPDAPEADEISEVTELDELQTFVSAKKHKFGSRPQLIKD